MEPKKPLIQTPKGDMKAYLEEVTPDGVAKIRIEGNDVEGFKYDEVKPSTSPALGLSISAAHLVEREHPEVTSISIEGYANGEKVYGAKAQHDNDWAIQITQKPEKEPEPQVNNEPIYIGAGTKEYIENKKMFETNLTPDQKNLYNDIEKLKSDMHKLKMETWAMVDLPSQSDVIQYYIDMERLQEKLKQKTEEFDSGLTPWQKDLQEGVKRTETKSDFTEKMDRDMERREADYYKEHGDLRPASIPETQPYMPPPDHKIDPEILKTPDAPKPLPLPDFEVEVHKGGGTVPFNEKVLKAQELMAKMKELAGGELSGVNLGHFKNHSGTGNDGLDGRFGKMTHESVQAVEKYLGIDPPTGKITGDLAAKMQTKIDELSPPATGLSEKLEKYFKENPFDIRRYEKPEVICAAPDPMAQVEDILRRPSCRIGTPLLETMGVKTDGLDITRYSSKTGDPIPEEKPKTGMDDSPLADAMDLNRTAPPVMKV